MLESKQPGVLARQIDFTRATWKRLVSHGVTASTLLRLDFFYECPSRERAKELEGLLVGETDYDVHTVAHEDAWLVRGTTQPTTVTLAILEQWVDWMVAAGLQVDCTFDGWGTELPG
jgi:hypothetical protein